jgi:peptide/nickel transport system ATP-binding protein
LNTLEVRNLKKYFKTPRGMLHAVDNVSFTIQEGKTLGVVGESGCGKSTLGRTVIRLLEKTDGEIFFEGQNVSDAKGKKLKALRGNTQMIFQDPFSSLNPRMTVSQTIAEPMRIYKRGGRKEIVERVRELMETVGLSQRFQDSYPHELDGGRRQRIGVARALALNPKLIVCDEPVSALDVSIQAQIINLMQNLQEQRNLAYIFITHDLSVVRHISDEILVMYLGVEAERCPAKELFKNPAHPYTRALLSAIPRVNIHKKTERVILEGEITSPIDPPDACRFAARCQYALDICRRREPALTEIGENHFAACHRVGEAL